MNSRDVLLDGFGRVRDDVHGAVEGLDAAALNFRADKDANTIAWLVWHLSRVADDHVSEVAGVDQVWTTGGWARRFGLPFDEAATGYGHHSSDVEAVRADPALLLGYFDDVHQQTVRYVGGLHDADLDRIVDQRWDPPVTLGVRLVSVINDCTQHAGQAAFIRGLTERR
ncbi:MAG TPA: DUF664 domain-containing protein [Acidothermaceae bacterium]|jgi:hypothetical protein